MEEEKSGHHFVLVRGMLELPGALVKGWEELLLPVPKVTMCECSFNLDQIAYFAVILCNLTPPCD